MAADPFFNGIASSAMITEMSNYINAEYKNFEYSMWQIAWMSVKCLNDNYTGCTPPSSYASL
ncbi:MAG: hypothetical protein WDO71_19430 [Bacteroidota bacterium]